MLIIIYILGCESPICCKLDTVSCIHILTYSCNIVQEVALISTCISVKYIVIIVLLRCCAMKSGSN